MNLAILSAQYPFGKSEAYLDLEIPFLEQAGFSLTFMPEKFGEIVEGRSLSQEYSVFGSASPTPSFLPGSISRLVRDHAPFRTLRWNKNRVVQLLQACRAFKDASSLLRQSKKFPVIFYSYWLTSRILGVRSAIKEFPDSRAILVSRAHRYEMFGDEYDEWSLGARVAACDEVHSVSSIGTAKLSASIQTFSSRSRVQTTHLGVPGPSDISIPERQNLLNCVSVSWVYPLKQVHKILAALHEAASACPKTTFVWHHFGDGPGLESLRGLAGQLNSNNLKVVLHGRRSHSEILQRLNSGDYDVFLNASQIEGVPVSIMEAMAAGLCVIAPNVGGIPDTVNSTNGFLVSPVRICEEIADALTRLAKEPLLLKALQARARLKWQNSFSDGNLQSFANHLLSLSKSGEF